MKLSADKCFAFLLLILSAAVTVRAETPLSRYALVYYMPVNYNGSVIKDDALVEGIYYYQGNETSHGFEAEYDITRIDYISGYEYKQRDYTFAYSKYAPYRKTQLGFHAMRTPNGSDDGNAFFAAWQYYKKNGKDTRFEVSATKYTGHDPELWVYQFTPSIGRTVPKANGSSIQLRTSAYVIYMPRELGSSPRNFYSAEQTVSWVRDRTTVTASGWIGEQMFAVRNGGFAVFNTPELHDGGYGLSIAYALSEDTKVTLFAKKELFSDFGTANSASATQTGVSVGHSF